MRNLKTDVLIVGGGATGTGLVRDLAMRGFKTILVEQRDLASGTTGRYHGLLHSGGRYVVKDPLAAKECMDENVILRRIMPECIEDTGGFFVQTPGDDPTYADAFIAGCRRAGIPCEELSISTMLHAEPLLNPAITRCFRVPDASADSFLAADLNAESARQHGAVILRYHPVQNLLKRDESSTVYGALCHDQVKDEDVRIEASLVVNAAGAWAGKIASTAGIHIQMIPGKGILVAINHRVVNTVINRCKMPGDGDILVPAHTVAVIGTTDVKVPDPDHFGIEPWEVQLMLEEGEKLIPGFRSLRFLRAWAGVRPLYQEVKSQKPGEATENRDITRAFVLLDHASRDGVDGVLTITSGKWTTYRKMAEVTADKVCEKLGVHRECRTHLEALPPPDNQAHHTAKTQHQAARSFHHLGHRLAAVETAQAYGKLICECEMATWEDVVHAILDGHANSLDDIRRDIRLGMGPCQAGFCSLRATGMLHQFSCKDQKQALATAQTSQWDAPQTLTVTETNVALRDFLQERWKGLIPILWGQQLRQERLNELVYLNVLNTDHLPGPVESRLSPVMYEQRVSTSEEMNNTPAIQASHMLTPALSGKSSRQPEVLVIGAGLAGLTAAWHLAANGKKVKLIAKGWGTTHWASGCIDVLGYDPSDRTIPVASPEEAIEKMIRDQPRHPYALVGLDQVLLAIRSLQVLFDQMKYPLHGSLAENWRLPTALGAIRATCLAPETMIAGDLRSRDPMLIVGFEQFLDFYPALVAANLNAQNMIAQETSLDLPALKKRRFVNGMVLARLFDKPDFRAEVVKALKPSLGKAARVGFPPVLGLQQPLEVLHDLESQLGCRVFEIPGLPPSVPGIRMHTLLVQAIRRKAAQVYDGMQVTGANGQDNHLQAVSTETGTGKAIHQAETFVLATGGVLGGGFAANLPGYAQNSFIETAIGLPLQAPLDRQDWFQQKFLGPQGHAIFSVGLRANVQLQPEDETGNPLFDNLFVVGGALGYCDPVREGSLEGIAVATGYRVAQQVLQP